MLSVWIWTGALGWRYMKWWGFFDTLVYDMHFAGSVHMIAWCHYVICVLTLHSLHMVMSLYCFPSGFAFVCFSALSGSRVGNMFKLKSQMCIYISYKTSPSHCFQTIGIYLCRLLSFKEKALMYGVGFSCYETQKLPTLSFGLIPTGSTCSESI